MATGATTVSTKQTTRIQQDLEALRKNPLSFIKDLELSNEDGLNVVTGVMIGPEKSDYQGGHFRFKVIFPPEYPFKFPEFVFNTAICHPNVSMKDNAACHDQLMATWAPTIKLANYLTEIQTLLAKPNYATPVEGDPALEKTREKAQQWTQQFATPTS